MVWVELDPVTVDVDPGTAATVTVSVRNTGNSVEDYHLEVVGDPGDWCQVEPRTLRIHPGASGVVYLVFSPRHGAGAHAGPRPYVVTVTPRADQRTSVVVEGTVRLAVFDDLRARLLPETSGGWRRGRVRLAVDNHGNAPVSAAVSGEAAGAGARVDIRSPALSIQPGRAHFSTFSVRPSRLLWTGAKAQHAYTITVTPSVGKPVAVRGVYQQSVLMPRWLQGVAALACAAAVAVVALWFGLSHSVNTDTKASPVARPNPLVLEMPQPGAPVTQASAKPKPTPRKPTPRPSKTVTPAPPPNVTKAPPTPSPSPSTALNGGVNPPTPSSPSGPPPGANCGGPSTEYVCLYTNNGQATLVGSTDFTATNCHVELILWDFTSRARALDGTWPCGSGPWTQSYVLTDPTKGHDYKGELRVYWQGASNYDYQLTKDVYYP
jgi:hypothetical protein